MEPPARDLTPSEHAPARPMPRRRNCSGRLQRDPVAYRPAAPAAAPAAPAAAPAAPAAAPPAAPAAAPAAPAAAPAAPAAAAPAAPAAPEAALAAPAAAEPAAPPYADVLPEWPGPPVFPKIPWIEWCDGTEPSLGAVVAIAVATLSPNVNVLARISGQNNCQISTSRHGHSNFGWTFWLSFPQGFSQHSGRSCLAFLFWLSCACAAIHPRGPSCRRRPARRFRRRVSFLLLLQSLLDRSFDPRSYPRHARPGLELFYRPRRPRRSGLRRLLRRRCVLLRPARAVFRDREPRFARCPSFLAELVLVRGRVRAMRR